jgi:hypothetical protein
MEALSIEGMMEEKEDDENEREIEWMVFFFPLFDIFCLVQHTKIKKIPIQLYK